MLKTPTLLIVGAGASCEFGLPVGSQLSAQIRDAVDFSGDAFGRLSGGDAQIRHALEHLGCAPAEIFATGQRIRKGLPLSYSIDNYLDKFRSDFVVQAAGRLGIVKMISAAEAKSRLFVDPSNI